MTNKNMPRLDTILFLVGQLGTGGSERQLCNLVQQLTREKKYRVGVAVWRFAEREHFTSELQNNEQVSLFRFPEKSTRVYKLLQLRQIIKQFSPQIVHSYTFHTNIWTHLACQHTSASAVGSVKSEFTFDIQNTGPVLGRLCARFPRAMIFNSERAQKNAQEEASFFSPRYTYVVPNGVDFQRFFYQPIPDKPDARLDIVSIASLLPIKRLDWSIKLIHILRQKGLNAYLQILGQGPERENLEKIIRTYSLEPYVELMGKVTQVASFIHRANFVVHPSLREGCPNAVMEAMACGRAVVATRAGDTEQVIEQNQTGFHVDRDDFLGWVEKAIFLCRNSDVCRKMGESGRERMEKNYTLENLAENTVSAYLDILEKASFTNT